MAYAAGSFEAALDAAAGADVALRAELRTSFLESAAAQMDLMQRARCDGNWRVAATRLHGLGATFHAGELADLAAEALDGAPGDPVVLRKIGAFLARMSAG